ncbi:MAG: type II toxin-antitoxin system Phd/YefM family antitoxin [Bacilli bacterium]|nr:type II toxin-antitoxin system Phd/YefM family antitoxin [Bacilli bacterium]
MEKISVSKINKNYSKFSSYCHTLNAPLIITKFKKDDAIIMSIDHYNELVAKLELYSEIAKGFNDIKNGNCKNFDNLNDLL